MTCHRFAMTAVVLLLLASGCSSVGQSQPPKPTPSVVAAPIDGVVALGRLEPEGEVIKLSVPNAQDSRVDQMLVKEGDRVEASQVIAVLQGIERREAELRDAEAEVKLREAELLKVQQGESKVSQLAAQAAAINRLIAQLETSQIQRQAEIATARATLQNAQLTYQRRQQLNQSGALSTAEVDSAVKDLAIAQANLQEKEASLAQTIKTLEAEITQAQSQLQSLREVRPVDVQIAQAQLEKARIAVTQKQANMRDAQVRVPIAGQILRINTRVGEQVNTQQGIVELAKTNQMYAIAEIPESTIGKVKQGQKATISSEYASFEGELQGMVESIGLQVGKKGQPEVGGTTPTTDQNARVITVRVKINPTDSKKVAAFTNMQVRVKLHTSAVINRLKLPIVV
jgi:HlyD family secretion protein